MRTVLALVLALLLGNVPIVAAAPNLVIKVVSNRADLISGGDALVTGPLGANLRAERSGSGAIACTH